MSKRLLSLLCATLFVPTFASGSAHALLTGDQTKTFVKALMEATAKAEHAKHKQLYCYVAAWKANSRLHPNIPGDIIEAYKTHCASVLKPMSKDASLIAPAVAEFGDRVEVYGRAMAIPPLQGMYKHGDLALMTKIAEVQLIEPEALDLAAKFVAALPSAPTVVNEADASATRRMKDLWDIVLASSFAGAHIDEHVIPDIHKNLDSRIADAAESPDSYYAVSSAASEMVEWLDVYKKAKKDDPKLAEYQKKHAEVVEQARAIWRKTLEERRMPKDTYKGGDRAAIIKHAKDWVAKEYKGDKFLRIVINADKWTEPYSHGRWERQLGGKYAFKWGTWKALRSGAIALERKLDGKTVYEYIPFNVYKKYDYTSKRFGEMYVDQAGYPHEMLKKHINK